MQWKWWTPCLKKPALDGDKLAVDLVYSRSVHQNGFHSQWLLEEHFIQDLGRRAEIQIKGLKVMLSVACQQQLTHPNTIFLLEMQEYWCVKSGEQQLGITLFSLLEIPYSNQACSRPTCLETFCDPTFVHAPPRRMTKVEWGISSGWIYHSVARWRLFSGGGIAWNRWENWWCSVTLKVWTYHNKS